MTPRVILWMLSLAPRAPAERIVPLADVIATVAQSPGEAADLTTLAFVETTLGKQGVPFGISCCARRGMPLKESAAIAGRIMRRAREVCGRDLASRHSYFRTGRCRPDAEAFRRAKIARKLLRSDVDR